MSQKTILEAKIIQKRKIFGLKTDVTPDSEVTPDFGQSRRYVTPTEGNAVFVRNPALVTPTLSKVLVPITPI